MTDSEIAPEAIDGRFVPAARPEVAAVVVGNEIVLGRVAAGTTHVQTAALNESGSIVWQCFDGSGTIDEIAADIAHVFGTDVAAVQADVGTLAREVGGAGFLVGVHEHVTEIGDDPSPIAVGLPFPAFEADDTNGRPFSRAPLAGRRALLISWSPTCEYCALIADDLRALEPSLTTAGVTLVRLVVRSDAIAGGFAGLGTPVAYLVDEHGYVAEPAALGASGVIALARRIAAGAGGS